MNLSCTPSNAFDIKANVISLKKHPDDLLMYFSGEDTGLKLTKCAGLNAPYDPTEPNEYVRVKQDGTGYPYTFVDKGHELTYYKNNFIDFINGSIRFTVKKEDCKEDFSYQDFSGFKGVAPGTYSVFFSFTNKESYNVVIHPVESELKKYYEKTGHGYVLTKDTEIDPEKTYYVRNNNYHVYSITINVANAITDLAELSAILNRVSEETVDDYNILTTEVLNNDTLRFRTKPDYGAQVMGYLEMSELGNEESLQTWFSKIETASYFCAPDVDTKIISFHEANSENNEISLIHKTDGFVYLFMSDENNEYTLTKKVFKWDWNNEDFREIEVNFDSSLSNVIVEGEVRAFFETVGVSADGTSYDSIIRSKSQNTYLTFVGGGDAYGFREFDVFTKKQHCGSYKSPSSVLAYNGRAFIEYHYGEIDVFNDCTLEIEGDGDLFFQAIDVGIPLSYTEYGPGGERAHIVVQSSDIDEFIQMFKNIDYDEDSTLSFQATDLIFRVIFKSKDAKITKFEFNPGTAVYDASDPYNFEDIYDWVRRQLGAPQITCELTDEQIYDALCKAVEKYNKYRNWNENLSIENLYNADPEDTTILRRGYSEKEGRYFILPAHISDKDVVDIFFQPRFSTCWFGAGDTFLNNVMSQTFFGLYGGIVQNSADYYIWRASCNDISNIIGTQISWRIYNHHLYITPGNLHDLDQFKVGIKYRPSLTVEEIRNSEDIKALTLAYAMRTLGLIRGAFGGSVQAGDIAIQLNAETLLAEADKLEDKTIALLKSEQKPLWMIWS